MVFIPISAKKSSTGIPTVGVTATDISGSHYPCMLPVISCLVGAPIKLKCVIITTETVLSASILSFVNRTTVWWSAIYFIIFECTSKDTSVDAFSASFSLHYSVDLLHCDIMSHSHIILAGRCHINNCYCNNLDRHLCTK